MRQHVNPTSASAQEQLHFVIACELLLANLAKA